jgi:hypothetical protein
MLLSCPRPASLNGMLADRAIEDQVARGTAMGTKRWRPPRFAAGRDVITGPLFDSAYSVSARLVRSTPNSCRDLALPRTVEKGQEET